MPDISQVIPALFSASALTTPQAIRTDNAVANPLATVTMPAFAPLGALPGEQIIVDSGDLRQPFHGVGAALTDSTCWMLTKFMTPAQRHAFLTQAFSPGADAFRLTRICMGTSDFTARPQSPPWYSYDDNGGVADPTLANFSVVMDEEYIIPVLQEALAINPGLKFFAAPWSPPGWMKTSPLAGTNGMVQGAFNTSYYSAYANYFVKFLQAYQSYGIPVYAVSPQNEPSYSNAVGTSANGPQYPSCTWGETALKAFIPILRAALDTAGFDNVKILGGDDNPSSLSGAGLLTASLADTSAGPALDGAAFHGYGSNTEIGMQNFSSRPYPYKETWFTEYSNFYNSCSVAQDIQQCAGQVGIAVGRAGARGMILWNLALDPTGQLTGANKGLRSVVQVATDGSGTVTKTGEYYFLCHISRYVRTGAYRCRSTTYAVGAGGGSGSSPGGGQPSGGTANDVESVAFVNRDGQVAVFLYNAAGTSKLVTVTDAASGQGTFLTMAAGDMVTVTWGGALGLAEVAGSNTLTPPTQATGLTGQNASGQVSLSWTAPSSTGNTALEGYLIRRSTTQGAEAQTVGSALSGQTTWTDADVVLGTTYYYQVFAFNGAGLAPASNEASATPVASPPTNAQVTASAGNATVSLTITAQMNGASASQVNILRGTTSGGESATPIGQATISTNPTTGQLTATYADTTVTNGTAYYYEAQVVTTPGTTTSTEASATPAAPTNPGAGQLISQDMGAAASQPTSGWCFASNVNTYSPGTVSVSSHNNVTDPGGGTTASTLVMNGGGSGGYASVGCDSTGSLATGTHTATVWLRGHAGGEQLQFSIYNSGIAKNSGVVLTTSWAQYSVSGTATSSGQFQFNIGTLPNVTGAMTIDMAWPNLT